MLDCRPASLVMDIERLGSLFASRLSFSRILTRQMLDQNWRITTQRFDLDTQGYGTAIYRISAPSAYCHLVIFCHKIDDSQRTDRVIAEVWDLTCGLVEGDVDEQLLSDLRNNIPLQEAGRQNPKVLVLSRANKSLRNFASFIDCLSKGTQPDPKWITKAPYLYRTSAVYGNGKFGIADYQRLIHSDDLARPFSAQMLSVFVLRHFSIQQIEYLAKCKNPKTAVTIDSEIRRYLGIGNSTGLGMAPFLIRHPQLIQCWIHTRELALSKVSQQPIDNATVTQLSMLIDEAVMHLQQTITEDAQQQQINQNTADDLLQAQQQLLLNEHLLNEHLNTDGNRLWHEFITTAQNDYAVPCQELLNNLLLELYPTIVDPFIDNMWVSEHFDLNPNMTVKALIEMIEQHYDWALQYDFNQLEARYWFWYVSEEKEEPRLGIRAQEAGSELEQPLAIAARVQRLYQSLKTVQGNIFTVLDFLTADPENGQHKDILRRVQTMSQTTYGEIRANLWHKDMKPMHLLRAKLSFFGASRFDPKSDRWVRVALFQGAPLVEEINELSDANNTHVDLKRLDNWSFPIEPVTNL